MKKKPHKSLPKVINLAEERKKRKAKETPIATKNSPDRLARISEELDYRTGKIVEEIDAVYERLEDLEKNQTAILRLLIRDKERRESLEDN